MKMVMNYAIPLVPNELSWTVIHSSDRMIISTFVSIAANGLIAVAAKISTIYTTFSRFSIRRGQSRSYFIIKMKADQNMSVRCSIK